MAHSETPAAVPPLLLPPPPKAAAAAASVLAPGFRFHPTDDELVSYYLKRKVCGKAVRINAISEVDIYKSEPWELPEKSQLQTRDQEWYFFSALDKKYGNGARMNRATYQGYWKATGNDRAVRHGSQVVGMKKTLVFHSGRAPGGKRTDWVMHEYRLADEENEKASPAQGYVLCRVFQKSGIGPPSGGSRYAPFVEEEWNESVLVPGEEVADEGEAAIDDRCVEQNNNHQDAQIGNFAPNLNEPPADDQNGFVCKAERKDDHTQYSPSLEPAILRYKRRRHGDSDSNRSTLFDSLTRAAQEASSTGTSSATTTTSAATNNKNNNLLSLVELSLMEPVEPKECREVPPPSFDSARADSFLPTSCQRLFDALRSEIHNISVERETLKLEMLSSQAMINILQSRVDHLTKENNELKRMAGVSNNSGPPP